MACVCVVQRRAFAAEDHLSAATAAREIGMAAAKKKASKKARKATKATKKPQKAAKPTKAPKVRAKAKTPQNATGTATNGLQNPFRVGGSYWASVEALKTLGVGRMHPLGEIVPAVREALGENWKLFAEKDARSEKTGKDADHRVLQNISTLSRADYGKPLREVGYEVRWNGRERVAGLFKLGSE